MREIPLSRGLVALVDDEDYDWLVARGRWYAITGNARGKFYAAHGLGGGRVELMHRVILGAPKGRVVDHLNSVAVDNRRANLRLCTPWENAANRHKERGTSRFKGVSWHKRGNAWQAAIRVHGVGHYLGWFKNEAEAALVYDAAARRYLGVNAPLNFPREGERSALLRGYDGPGTETQTETQDEGRTA